MNNDKIAQAQIQVHPKISAYLPIVEAVTKLMYPFMEAAVHDLSVGKLVAIYNNISRRNIGDRSPLEELKTPVAEFPDYFEPYYKDNWDGKKLKCTSVTIRDDDGTPIGLICFNFSTEFFSDTAKTLQAFLKVKSSADNPVSVYEDNPREAIKTYIDKYLLDNHTQIDQLATDMKVMIVNDLYDKGYFNYKNAPSIIASILDVSRGSIYNYLQKK